MRHKRKIKKLGMTSSHRSAVLMNMAISLIKNERIVTTLSKAKSLRPYVEKLVTKAKLDNVSRIRYISAKIKDYAAVKKLFTIFGERYKERCGGYLRIVKIGTRHGDAAKLAYVEFVDSNIV